MRKYGVYPEQILLFVLVVLVWYAWFCNEINREPCLQQPISPQQADFWGEMNKTFRESSWRNPMQGRKSDMPGGLN